MSQPIIYIDKSEIREGKYEEVRESIQNLVEFVEENVPQLINYSFFFNKDRTQMTVVSVHPDSDSLQYHMDTGKEEFRKFAGLLDLSKIEVYGEISDTVHDLLIQKAQMLGDGTVDLHDFGAGFFRS